MEKVIPSQIIIIFLFFSLVSCSQKINNHYIDGAQEFILDSYQISQGNFTPTSQPISLKKSELEESIFFFSNLEPISFKDFFEITNIAPTDFDIIEIERNDDLFPKRYSLSQEQILFLPSERLLLIPGDNVLIKKFPFFSLRNAFHY